MKSRQVIFPKHSDVRFDIPRKKRIFRYKRIFGKELIVSHEKVEFIFVIKHAQVDGAFSFTYIILLVYSLK